MTTTLEDELQLLTPAQAAKTLAISRKTLDRLCEAGALKPVRLFPNGNRRFRISDIHALVVETKEDDDG